MSEQTPDSAPEAQEASQEQQAPQQTETQQPNSAAPQEEAEQAWDPERAMEKIRKINSENKALRERASKAEEQARSLPELQQQVASLESQTMRLQVGYELGLPINLATRLQGSTRDELVADAEALVSLVSSPTKPAPASARPVEALRPGATPSTSQNEDDVLYNSLFGG